MLSPEQNRSLTEVGPDKPMGQLLRRYWLPFAGASELDDKPIQAVRLLGEDLVLFRDLGGRYGLLDRHCPHRRADLTNGFVEDCGIRCSYHGWQMRHDGAVTAVPFDDLVHPHAKVKERITIKSYPVRELGGLLFTYMGPAPAPELPILEPLTRKGGFMEVVRSQLPCNWLQCQENSIDPVHFEWIHDNWSLRLKGSQEFVRRHIDLAFEEVPYGHLYRRISEGQDERDELWTSGRMVLWPIGFYLGDQFEWRVPVDDDNTLNLCWFYSEPPKDVGPYRQHTVPTWECPTQDGSGNWITSHVLNQDFVAWIGQGRIADRTREHLAASDRGVVMLRKAYFDAMRIVQQGLDPKWVIRDPEIARLIKLPPIVGRTMNSGQLTLDEWKRHPFLKGRLAGHRHCAGQPARVRNEYIRAMGFDRLPQSEWARPEDSAVRYSEAQSGK
jgi:5,5'-dehydrodivanillate O-demethylase